MLETGDGPSELRTLEPGVQWLGLEVNRHTVLGEDRAEVPFATYSKFGGRAHRLQACSRFAQKAVRWLNLSAEGVASPTCGCTPSRRNSLQTFHD